MADDKATLRRQRSRIRHYVNEHVPVQALLRQLFNLDIDVGQTFRCPLHDDNRKSAKLYADNAFFCYACNVQFTPYRILRDKGYDLDQIAQQIPPDFMPDLSSEIERKEELERLKVVASGLRAQYVQDDDLVKLIWAWVVQFSKA